MIQGLKIMNSESATGVKSSEAHVSGPTSASANKYLPCLAVVIAFLSYNLLFFKASINSTKSTTP